MHPLNQITLMCTQLCIKALHLFNNYVIFFGIVVEKWLDLAALLHCPSFLLHIGPYDGSDSTTNHL